MEEYKGFKIVMDGTFGMWHIKQLGSGAVPSELSGDYTSQANAKIAINSYKPKRGAKDHGEADSTV